ncbi:flagellar motor switch protein [Thalassococcus profundi]|uniref:Flagellar motor switch protein n=1 Tax=Thalassococcus profundi TaxID=2282382 RepID=A0A369TKP5_9RHOB|nr:flagellar motor switch protein [Thalassococcus profundi]RDD65412.1 flagellar motor switch protein [Thalassococcus profundi]
MLPTLIDFIIVVLLIGTLVYAYLLDRRVRTLMLALREMEPMVGAFSSAVDQSARSIEDLRELSVTPRRAEPPLQRRRGAAPADEPRPTQKTTAASPDPKGPVRGQTSVPGKSDLVRTFFDITKERQK